MKRPGHMCSFENTRRTLWLKVLLAVAVFETSGCTVGPKYQRPAAAVPPAYKEVGDWKPAQPNDQNLGGNWWTVFQHPQLDALLAPVVAFGELPARLADILKPRSGVLCQLISYA